MTIICSDKVKMPLEKWENVWYNIIVAHYAVHNVNNPSTKLTGKARLGKYLPYARLGEYFKEVYLL